jgi:hypothetical protein
VSTSSCCDQATVFRSMSSQEDEPCMTPTELQQEIAIEFEAIQIAID